MTPSRRVLSCLIWCAWAYSVDDLLSKSEELAKLLGAQFGYPALAGSDDVIGKGFLGLDHLIDLLLHSAAADVLVDLDVAGLTNPEGPIGRLVFNSRVPPAVIVEDFAGPGQIQSGAACLDRKDECARTVRVGLKAIDHCLPRPNRRSTVQEQYLLTKGLLQILLDQFAHLNELSEDQAAIAARPG